MSVTTNDLGRVRRPTSPPSKREKATQRIVFILDETFSMNPRRDVTISGINEYVGGVAEDKTLRTLFTLVKFNFTDGVRIAFQDQPIQKFSPMTREQYIPAGNTNLYDAIGETIQATEARMKDQPPCRVLCVIMTDGEENASRTFSRDQIYDLIKEKEGEGWTFVYLGADADTWKAAELIGLNPGNITTYNARDIKEAFGRTAARTLVYMVQPDVMTLGHSGTPVAVQNFWGEDLCTTADTRPLPKPQTSIQAQGGAF